VDFYEIIALCLMIVGVTMLIVIFGSIRSDDRAKSRPFHCKENGRAQTVTHEEEETTNLGGANASAGGTAFMSQFLKAIAFGFFFVLLIVFTMIVVWIAGLEFGQLISNR
jgi:hypothetical protein